MQSNASYQPGQIVPASGIYAQFTNYNAKINEITCIKGEPFPPTQLAGYYYQIISLAIHKPSNG